MRIELKNNTSRALVETNGARLLGWRVNRREGLHYDQARPKRVTHPCGPNFGPLCNAGPLVKDGKYEISGQLHELPVHGFLRDMDWSANIYSRHCVELALMKKKFPGYPFFGRFTTMITLTGTSLKYELTFRNLGEIAAPVDLASHTYHPFEPGLKIDELKGLIYNDQTRWEQQTKRTMTDPVFRRAEHLDWHFTLDRRRSFTLNYPSGRRIALRGDGNMQQVVTWANPDEGNFICLEPVLCGRNALNLGNAVWVQPGDSVSLRFSLTLL